MAANWGWARQLRQAVDDRLIGGPHVVIDLPRLVQFFKGESSYAASRLPGNVLGLRWAPDYSATTVGPKQLAEVIRYINGQAEHHPGEGVEGGVRRRGAGGRGSMGCQPTGWELGAPALCACGR